MIWWPKKLQNITTSFVKAHFEYLEYFESKTKGFLNLWKNYILTNLELFHLPLLHHFFLIRHVQARETLWEWLQIDCLCVVSNCIVGLLWGRNLTQFPKQPHNSPLWGCAGDQVEMVVKVHCGTVLGDQFAATLKMLSLKQSHNALRQPSPRSPAQPQRGE